MDELRFYASVAILGFQNPEHRFFFADGFAFVHGNACGFVEHQQRIVFVNDFELVPERGVA